MTEQSLSINQGIHLTRIDKVMRYVQSHLDSSLNMKDLADIACFSAFHFQRLFCLYTGQSLAKYILISRLRKACWQLAFRQHMSLIDIALSCGFNDDQSFSRAFKRQLGIAPSLYRKGCLAHAKAKLLSGPQPASFMSQKYIGHVTLRTPELNKRRAIISTRHYHKDSVQIVDFPQTAIAFLAHHGSPETLMATVARFIEWRKEFGSPPSVSKTFNILYNDPQSVEPQAYRFDVAASLFLPFMANDYGVQEGEIRAGKCAVLRHIGSDNDLGYSIEYLYRDWFSQANAQLRDEPLFIQRVRSFPDVDEQSSIIDIYLPID
tara:strand:- start:705 stop:1664 length:960 start_codon:yes stop_codon:yes gene_type:complete